MATKKAPAKKAAAKKAAAVKKSVGAKTIGINMKMEMADEIERRASSMHLSASKYVKLILADWLSSDNKLKLEES